VTGNDARALRQSLSLSQVQMARRLFVSRREYQYAEAKRSEPIGEVMTLVVNGLRWDLEKGQAA
jgi:DNA-binding transcriptional regulator YiaG